jgi:chromosome segregation ATPase
MKEIEQLTKEARKELAHYVSAYFDVLYYQELVEDKGDKTMSVEKCGNQVEAREGQITQELNEAENAANRLDVRLGELETQLSLILHPSDPPIPDDKVEKKPEIPLVQLAQRIRDHYRFLQDLGTRVGGMRGRLEIR